MEGELIAWVQEQGSRTAGIVINLLGYTTTSVALLATGVAAIEVHVSNFHRRQVFRRQSRVSQAAGGVVRGPGVRGYAVALEAMADLLEVNH